MLKLNVSSTNFQTFNAKMILSTSKEDKKILLWDESTLSVVFTYEDPNMKNYISENKLITIGKDLFSEYIITLQENKSLMSVWKTNTSECFAKCSPIDERITTLDASLNNKILFIGTETGMLYLYEVFSGNIITSVNVSSSAILSCKSLMQDGSIICILTGEYIKLYSFENLLSKNNVATLQEVPNYDTLNNFFFMTEFNLFVFSSQNKNKIVFYSYPDLKIIKNVYLHLENINIKKIINDMNFLYVTMENSSIFKIDICETLKNLEFTISYNLFENLFPVIQIESSLVSSVCLSQRNIIVGCDDGKIRIYNKSNYNLDNTFSNHKGGITNIAFVNRPISQFGLSFNNNLEESFFKHLKKPSSMYNPSLLVKNSIRKANYMDTVLEENLVNDDNSQFDEGKNYAFDLTENLISQKQSINLKNQVGAVNDSNMSKVEYNLNDPEFLKKKLNELYNIINK